MRLWLIALMLSAAMCLPAFAGEPLLLEVWVNGKTRHQVVRVEKTDSDVLLARADLVAAGLRVAPGSSPVALRTLVGVTARIDEVAQQLLLTVQPDLMAPQVFDLRPSLDTGVTPSVPARGATLRYDASIANDDIRRGLSNLDFGSTLGLAIYARDALFVANGFARDAAGQVSGARLDSALVFDDPQRLRRLVFGDAISGSLAWSRAVRFGGVQFASDFSLQPDLVTLPMPDFFGTAAVPEALEVYSGAAQMFEQDVDAGPFEIHNIPVVTGGGSATVVTRDVLGRETTQSISLYTTNALLNPGLTSYAFDLGFLRRGYGITSFGYASPIASVTLRRGISNRLTLEAHGEASPHRALGGAGATLSLWQVAGFSGALSLGGSSSGSSSGGGWLGNASLELRGGPFSLFGEFAAADRNYRDIASLDGPLPDRIRAQVGLTTDLGRAGVLGLNWIRAEHPNGTSTRLLTSSYTVELGRGLYFGLSGLRDLNARQWDAQAFVSMPLHGGTASTSLDAGGGAATSMTGLAVPVDPDGGFGYRVIATLGERSALEGDVDWIGTHAQLDAGAALVDSKVALRGDVGGALVFLDGSVFAARDPGDAVALVKTGRPGVHITRENRIVAVADADGEALVTGLVPYDANHIGVESRDYAMSDILTDIDRRIAPRRSAAVIVDFSPTSHHPALLTLVSADGVPPPVGARVDVAGSDTPLIVGRSGQVFFADLDHAIAATVTSDRGRCSFRAAPRNAPVAVMALIGPVLCVGEHHAP